MLLYVRIKRGAKALMPTSAAPGVSKVREQYSPPLPLLIKRKVGNVLEEFIEFAHAAEVAVVQRLRIDVEILGA